MPEWVYMIAIFAALTIGFFVGNYTGKQDADKAPSENAWLNSRKIIADANVEIAKYNMEKEAEWKMAALQRGIYDHLPFDDLDDEDVMDDTTGMWG